MIKDLEIRKDKAEKRPAPIKIKERSLSSPLNSGSTDIYDDFCYIGMIYSDTFLLFPLLLSSRISRQPGY